MKKALANRVGILERPLFHGKLVDAQFGREPDGRILEIAGVLTKILKNNNPRKSLGS